MTILDIDFEKQPGPKYRAIAAALSEAIANGDLSAGERLPTQRELAWQLGVTVGTVSRAYAEIERRGLLSGEIGRGTYVRSGPPTQDLPMRAPAPPAAIDLTLNFPAPGEERRAIAEALTQMAEDPDIGALLDYQPDTGLAGHRAAGAAWIGRRGWPVDPERVIVTAGAQHGIVAALAALTRPGDRILTERLTYQGIKPASAMLGLRLEGLPMDAQGLLPDAFERAIGDSGARLIYCMPTVHNPTTITMPEDRKRDIAAVAIRHDVTIIEDDIYGILLGSPGPVPLATYAPDNTIYVTSLSKAVAPGLRIGFAVPPQELVERIGSAVRASCWMAAPLMADVAARWIQNGTADRILENHKIVSERRRALALRYLEGRSLDAPAGSLHVWLHLPEPWRAAEFVAVAQNRGVSVAPAETFAVGRGNVPHSVRICLGTPREEATLEAGLITIAELLQNADASLSMIV
ncbi:MAG: aminotransferase class I/II-fold pyridoxal phosphate-dependent enzyme [Alphaproteobacteria bacterium]|nr:aminotransferase class I/II-fold pyridoxal phosphate-dependent enzyme [Alphaproteobacteria bacterium]